MNRHRGHLLLTGVLIVLFAWAAARGAEPERRRPAGAASPRDTTTGAPIEPLEMDKRKSMLQPARKPETGPNLRPPGTHRSAPNVDWRALPPNYEPHWSVDPENLPSRPSSELLPRLGREYIEAREAQAARHGKPRAQPGAIFGAEPPRKPDLQFAVPEILRVRPGELEREAARQKIAELGPPRNDLDEERARVHDLSDVEWELYSADRRAAYERDIRRFERLQRPRKPANRGGR